MNDPVAVPLGFWLRRVDQLFESSMDEVLADEQLSRRQWQMLNTVARHQPASLGQCGEAMTLFLADASRECVPLLSELAGRSWIEQQEGRYQLTAAGQTMLEALQEKVAKHRAVMFAGVTDEDYRITVQTLATITKNLDPDRTGPTHI